MRRIEQIWTECRERFGEGGPFLFGTFGAADAMYAPIVSRFTSYGIGVGADGGEAYMAAITALPALGGVAQCRNSGTVDNAR